MPDKKDICPTCGQSTKSVWQELGEIQQSLDKEMNYGKMWWRVKIKEVDSNFDNSNSK